MKAAAAIVLVCGAAVAFAGPTHPAGKRSNSPPIHPPPNHGGGGATDSIPFADNFDSYANGSALAGQGGWIRWDPALSLDGVVTNAQSVSPSNSFKTIPQSDQVQTGPVLTTGAYQLTCKTFYPSTNNAPGANDGAFIIGLNRFNVGGAGMGNDYWSAQVQWMSNVVRNYDLQTQSTPMVMDQWVPFVMTIDLASDKYDATYNGQTFIFQRSWSQGTFTPGQVSITAFDFYGGNAAATLPFEFFIDDVKFAPYCYVNCDQSTGSPLLSANDFQCFLNAFAAAGVLPNADQITSYANCDKSTGSPALNANDFQCFLNAYAVGCT